MKNKYVLYLLCAGIILNSAEKQQKETEQSWKSINCTEIEEMLHRDYDSYVKNCLTEYKKKDFSPADMDQVISMQLLFSGTINFDLSHLGDESKNTFTHIAIQKLDLPMLQWLIKHGENLPYRANIDDQEPIDICIAHLLPNTTSNTEIAHQMLDMLTHEYDKYSFHVTARRKFLKKIVALQFEHRKNNTGFVLKDVLFTRFLRQYSEAKPSIFLADVYQEMMDQNNDTFTHIIVQQNLPDDLYDLIRKEYVTCSKNAEEKTPIDIACDRFRQFTQNSLLIESDKDSFIKSRCCLFMLLNYVQKKQNGRSGNFRKCCDRHIV